MLKGINHQGRLQGSFESILGYTWRSTKKDKPQALLTPHLFSIALEYQTHWREFLLIAYTLSTHRWHIKQV